VVTILGNLANILAAFLDFFIEEDAENTMWERLLLGIGTLLAWINLVRYLEFDKKYTVLISALQRVFPNALRFLLGALPVFIGFALFGVAYFSETSLRFSTFGRACVTLFGLQNGDDVQGTFMDTSSDMLVSRIYLALFVFISIYGVANIFIAIMDEAYGVSMQQTERLKRQEEAQALLASPSRESDLTNDDELWSTILGLSKKNKSAITIGQRGNKNTGSNTVGGSSDQGRDVAVSVLADDSDDNVKDDLHDDEVIKQFMEFIDEQHAKFRMEMKSSLKDFMNKRGKVKASKSHASASPQPPSPPSPLPSPYPPSSYIPLTQQKPAPARHSGTHIDNTNNNNSNNNQ